MARKESKYPSPSKTSRTRPGTRQNDRKKPAVPGSGRGRPAKGYDPATGTWHQERPK